MSRTSASLAIVLVSIGCSPGGGSGGSAAAGYGLEERPPAATLTFPTAGPRPAPVEVVNAFPNLSFVEPLFLGAPNDGSDRIFVVERGGRIHVFPNDPAASAAAVFLDITDRIFISGGEEGLLGLAFDPGYASNGWFYVHYTAGSPRRSVFARFSVSSGDPDAADATSERVMLEVPQPYSNHNGGMLAFGPDGMLYASLGDGGSGGDPLNHGQDLTTLLGSIIRIRPEADGTYSVPADNPFVGAGGGVREEIWAYGLRHPWRFSFDRQTGALWVGDVGQNDREEVDVVEKGDNLGWRVYQGTWEFNNPEGLPFSDFKAPIHDIDRREGQSVTGGYVYRGTRLPSFRGAYVYADFSSNAVWALVHDRFELVSNTRIATVVNVSSFGEDEAGELYLVSLLGPIWRLEEAGEPAAGPFPARLSETGIFEDTAGLIAADGVIEFDVKVPLWADGARKRRWMALPGAAAIGFSAAEAWDFPLGTVLVKHFEIERAAGDPGSVDRLETRVFLKEESGWAGYTYRWNDDGTDADLLADAASEVLSIDDPEAPGGQRELTWTYPSRAQCLSCHTAAAGHVLGVRTRQLNRDFAYPARADNQLRAWNHIGLFSSDIGAPSDYGRFAGLADAKAPASARARAYLDVHCAICHRPGGPSPVAIDLRFDVDEDGMGIIGVPPSAGGLGISDPLLVRPGEKETSVLWERMRRAGGDRMPTLGTAIEDEAATEIIGRWIDALE
jgi:uncharacterized repeat protein (TIGR03806 family)